MWTTASSRLLASMFVLALVLSMSAPPVGGQGAEAGLPELGGWSLGAPLLAPISEQAVAELNGKVYIAGGYPGDRIPVDSVAVYDPATNGWRSAHRFHSLCTTRWRQLSAASST